MDASASSGRRRRIFRKVEEKLRIAKLTLEPIRLPVPARFSHMRTRCAIR